MIVKKRCSWNNVRKKTRSSAKIKDVEIASRCEPVTKLQFNLATIRNPSDNLYTNSRSAPEWELVTLDLNGTRVVTDKDFRQFDEKSPRLVRSEDTRHRARSFPLGHSFEWNAAGVSRRKLDSNGQRGTAGRQTPTRFGLIVGRRHCTEKLRANAHTLDT
jgi:hypothetical protein